MDCAFHHVDYIILVKRSDDMSRKQWSTAVDEEILERFKKLSEKTRIASTKLLDEALEDLLVKYNELDKSDKKTP